MSTWRFKTFLDHKVATVHRTVQYEISHVSTFLDHKVATVYNELHGMKVLIHLQTEGYGAEIPQLINRVTC